MAKVFNGLAIVAIATLLGTGSFAGYLLFSGKLNSERMKAIATILRDGVTAAPTTQPAQTEESAEHAPPQAADTRAARRQSAQQFATARDRDLVTNLELERSKEDIAAQRRLLDQSLGHLVRGEEHLVQQKTEFEEQQKQRESAATDNGFQTKLQYVSGLAPKVAKEYLLRSWKEHRADAVRLFGAIEQGKGQRILAQLKTPEEMDFMHQLLEQLSLEGNNTYADRSGKTARDTIP